jgi:tRNA A37 threonylcarbamoyltransferase TsaD
MISRDFPSINFIIPEKEKTGDNAVMIAFAGYIKYLLNPEILNSKEDFGAKGNLKIDQI